MVDVVLIELEGVVFDTRGAREASVRDAMTALGIGDASEIDEVVADLISLRAARAFAARIGASGLAMRPGARALIDEAAASARLAAVTRASRAELDVMLRLAGIETAFAVTVCADDALAAKPSAAGYNLALDRLS